MLCSNKRSISIEYNTVTRGNQITPLANPKEIIFTSYVKNLELTISEQQWDKITELVLIIKLDNIKDLIPPFY